MEIGKINNGHIKIMVELEVEMKKVMEKMEIDHLMEMELTKKAD